MQMCRHLSFNMFSAPCRGRSKYLHKLKENKREKLKCKHTAGSNNEIKGTMKSKLGFCGFLVHIFRFEAILVYY